MYINLRAFMNQNYVSFRKNIILGMFPVAILGTLSHFVYGLSGENRFIGLFFPVNESTWEHMKLAFFPMLLFTMYVSSKSFSKMGYSISLMLGILSATWLIPVLYYSYTGILGFSRSWLDIGTYYVSLILSTVLILHIAKHYDDNHKRVYNILCVCLLLQTLAFWIFTYKPPTSLSIFK